jgi:uncharacterized protein YggE
VWQCFSSVLVLAILLAGSEVRAWDPRQPVPATAEEMSRRAVGRPAGFRHATSSVGLDIPAGVVRLVWAPRPSAAQAPAAEPTRSLDIVVALGEAVVKVAPDRAFVTVTTVSRSRSPREAQRQNATTMAAVRQKLEEAGTAADAIRTLAVQLAPEFDYVEGRRALRGYVARNTIEVRVDAVDRLGDVLDAAVAGGATDVGEVRFDLKDRESVEREALRRAAAAGRARAEAAAAGAGRQADRVIRIEEGGAQVRPIPEPMVAMAARGASEAAVTPVTPGEIEIRAQVTVTMTLR